MTAMREIGQRLQEEQGLTADKIRWLVIIAQAILRAFTRDEGQPMRSLAAQLDTSPTTFYKTVRLAVQVLMWLYHRKQSVTNLVEQLQEMTERLAQAEEANDIAQRKKKEITKLLNVTQTKVVELEAKAARLQEQWEVVKDRLIVVLKMSGRCTVRSIVEVLEYGLEITVSVGYVQGIITQAGLSANTAMEKLLEAVTLSGAICIDEIYLKEMGQKIWGIVVVDPLSGLVLRFDRCSDRSKDAIASVLKRLTEAGCKEKIKLCLTDMYKGYVEPVATYLPHAAHQFCWFHINCFHLGAIVRRAKRAYERAVKELAAFDRKQKGILSPEEQKQRQSLVDECDQAHRHWVGAERCQRMILRSLHSPSMAIAVRRLDQIIRVAAQVKNPYVQSIGAFLDDHRAHLLTFYACLESQPHLLQRLSNSKRKWVPLLKRWAMPITTNAAEHVFRCFRRYTKQMDHFGTAAATQRFFDLFAFFHNVRILRVGKHAGNSFLAATHVDVIALFGTDDPYTMLGFPPATQTFVPVKSVQFATA